MNKFLICLFEIWGLFEEYTAIGLSPLFKAVVHLSFHFFTLVIKPLVVEDNCVIRLPGKEFLGLKEMALDFSAISDTTAIKFFTHSSTLSSLNDVLN